MAKRQPTWDISKASELLGYTVSGVTYAAGVRNRFYSDLRPVSDNAELLTRRELMESQNLKTYAKGGVPLSPEGRDAIEQTITFNGDSITISQQSKTCIFRFFVDIHHASGFHLPLLLTFAERTRIVAASTAQLEGSAQPSHSRVGTTPLLQLPREVRDQIYELLLPSIERRSTTIESFDSIGFPSGIGDLSGFLFPLGPELEVLRLCKQIRQEALPVAYRRLVFCLNDMDDVIKFLIAIGQVGRNSVESLEFPWESRIDAERRWDYVDSATHYLTLPSLHVARCVQLLRECSKLRFLRILIETDVLTDISEEAFKTDMGIQDLCSLQNIAVLQIWNPTLESVEHLPLAKWLKSQVQRA